MNISMESIKQEFKKWTSRVRISDINAILDDPDRLERIFKNRHLKKFVLDLALFLCLLRDYVKGDYREIPWNSIAAIVAALMYVASPVDLIPDVIPVIGFIDDAMVMALCLSFVAQDLDAYRQWKDRARLSG